MIQRFELREGLHRCPAHADRRPSLSIRRESDGRWLLHCFAGCRTPAILRVAGLTWRDLYPPGPAGPERVTPRQRRPPVPPAPAGVDGAAWRESWIEILAEANRQRARLAPYRDVYRVADWLRPRHQAVAHARRLASALGDEPRTWHLLSLAARVATLAAAIEAELDEATRRVA